MHRPLCVHIYVCIYPAWLSYKTTTSTMAEKSTSAQGISCSDGSQTQTPAHRVTPCMWNVQNKQIHRDVTKLSGLQDWEVGEMRSDCEHVRASSGDEDRVLEWDGEDGYTELWTCKSHWLARFILVSLMICELYLVVWFLKCRLRIEHRRERLCRWGLAGQKGEVDLPGIPGLRWQNLGEFFSLEMIEMTKGFVPSKCLRL